ncbi:MAG: hypothetical protein R2769_00530 [Saprospiraceae bacterium]
MDLLDKAYQQCKEMEKLPTEQTKNAVVLYKEFSGRNFSKIAEIITPKEIKPKG